MTAGVITGWAALLRHVTMGRALGAATVDTTCQEVRSTPGWLSTVFTGTSTFTSTNADAPGPTQDHITIGVDFNAARDQACISEFPPIDSGRATVTYAGGPLGTFDPTTGALAITLQLDFDLDLGTVINLAINEDSTLPVLLSTTGDSRASPVDRISGEATLVGTGVFRGGDVLDGDKGTLVLEGTFSPNPFPGEQVEGPTPPPSSVDGQRPMGGVLEAVLHVMMQ
jgi:hypothetical protein